MTAKKAREVKVQEMGQVTNKAPTWWVSQDEYTWQEPTWTWRADDESTMMILMTMRTIMTTAADRC